MISVDSIDKTILELESRDTTFANCSKLADLYICRDHIVGYSSAENEMVSQDGDSEFLSAVNGKPSDSVWLIVDELVTTVAVLQPKVYSAFISKINSI